MSWHERLIWYASVAYLVGRFVLLGYALMGGLDR